MSLSLQDYRAKLINKVLCCSTQKEVERYIDTAVKKLEQHGVGGHIVARFIDKTLDELDDCSPLDKTAIQWSNIHTAKILLFRKQQQMKTNKQ